MALTLFNQKVGPGLGREDVGGPGRVWAAENAADQALTAAFQTAGKVFGVIRMPYWRGFFAAWQPDSK